VNKYEAKRIVLSAIITTIQADLSADAGYLHAAQDGTEYTEKDVTRLRAAALGLSASLQKRLDRR
jgi:hypothetical protein